MLLAYKPTHAGRITVKERFGEHVKMSFALIGASEFCHFC